MRSMGKRIDRGFTIGAERDDDFGVSEAGSEHEREGGTGKVVLRMRDREASEFVWSW